MSTSLTMPEIRARVEDQALEYRPATIEALRALPRFADWRDDVFGAAQDVLVAAGIFEQGAVGELLIRPTPRTRRARA